MIICLNFLPSKENPKFCDVCDQTEDKHPGPDYKREPRDTDREEIEADLVEIGRP